MSIESTPVPGARGSSLPRGHEVTLRNGVDGNQRKYCAGDISGFTRMLNNVVRRNVRRDLRILFFLSSPITTRVRIVSSQQFRVVECVMHASGTRMTKSPFSSNIILR